MSVSCPEFSFVLCPTQHVLYMAEMLSVCRSKVVEYMQFKTKYNRKLSVGLSHIVFQHSVVMCPPVNLSTLRFPSYQQSGCLKCWSHISHYCCSVSEVLPKPTLRSFCCCRCRVGCVAAQNFVGKRRLPETQQHFSPFCLLSNHSTSFPLTRIPFSFPPLHSFGLLSYFPPACASYFV